MGVKIIGGKRMAMNDNKIPKEVNRMYVFVVYLTTILRALALSHQIVSGEVNNELQKRRRKM
jgi:hypothetical protein